MIGRNAHHARAVRNDDVARSDAYAGTGDGLVDAGDGEPRAPGQRRHVAREDGEAVLEHLFLVAHAAVDDEAADALELGRERGEPAERGDGAAARIDDDDVARVRGVDHGADAEVGGGEVTALARDLAHCDGAADAAGARHDLIEAFENAFESDVVERVGERRRGEAFEEREGRVVDWRGRGRHRRVVSILWRMGCALRCVTRWTRGVVRAHAP